MNGPQVEDGYTRIANEIVDNLAMTDMNGTQRRILDVVLRQTYGWQRKAYGLSISFISKATNINNKQIQRELNRLIERNILTVISEPTFNKSRKLQFNKHYEEWLGSEQVTNKMTGSELEVSTGSELEVSTGSELAPQIKKVNKVKESTNYKLVYDYYLTLNLIKHRAYTNDISKAIKKAMTDNKYSVEYCKSLLDRHKDVVAITKNSSYPVRVRGLSEFFGQKAFDATHLICSEYEEGGGMYEKYLKNKIEIKELPKQTISFDNRL